MGISTKVELVTLILLTLFEVCGEFVSNLGKFCEYEGQLAALLTQQSPTYTTHSLAQTNNFMFPPKAKQADVFFLDKPFDIACLRAVIKIGATFPETSFR